MNNIDRVLDEFDKFTDKWFLPEDQLSVEIKSLKIEYNKDVKNFLKSALEQQQKSMELDEEKMK